MENETREEGLTFGDIFRIVVKRIWYILGATVLVAVAAVLIVYFAVNPAQQWYSMQFTLVFPTGLNTSYPDGEPFFYQDMVKSGNLAEVKKAEGLSSVDTDRMVRDDEVEISAETKTENGVTSYTGRYTVRVKSTYFSGETQAETFIRTIAQTTVDKMCTEAGLVSYRVSGDIFDKAPFEERLNLLAQERETLLEKYDEWIDTYDAAYKLKVEIGTGEAKREVEQSLKDFRASVTACFGESKQKELEEELENGGYYFTDNFEEYTKKLDAEYTRNAAEIEELQKVNTAPAAAISLTAYAQDGSPVQIGSADPNVSQRLAELIKRNNMIAYWLGKDGNEATLTKTANDDFGTRINNERDKLEQAADMLTAVTKAIYARGMSARFDMQSVEADGGTSIILTGIASAIVAFVAACVVAYAVESSRRKKAKEAETPASAPEGSPEQNASGEKQE